MDAAAAGRRWSGAKPPPASPAVASSASPAVSSTLVPSPGTASGPDSARAPRGADTGEPTVLVMVRHGRTPLTEDHRMSGRGGADPGLSAAGREDARRAAAEVVRLGTPGSGVPDTGPAQVVICSPLLRTRQTAQAIADGLGLPVVVDDGWAEIGFGEWDGLTYGEIAERWPKEMAAWQGSVLVAPPGGESLTDHAARIGAARRRLVTEHPGKVVVVVAHVTPIRCVVTEALDAGPAALWRTRISPVSLTAVRYWSDGGTEVLTVNHVP